MNERFEELSQGWLNGNLSDGEREELQTLLRESRATRRDFVEWAGLDAALRDLGQNGEGEAWRRAEPASGPRAQRALRTPWIPWLAAAAALAALFLGAAIVLRNAGETAAAKPETMAEGFAVLTEAVDVDWSPGQAIRRRGDMLAEGRVRFRSGLAQIEFFGGATVILEGDVDFEIRSATEALLHSGRLRAHAPPAARGFVIRTPDMEVVDLGTEFAIDTAGTGSEIHVLDGEVEFAGADGASRRAGAGEAFALAPEGGAPRPIAPDLNGFTGVADLDQRSRASERRHYEQWQSFSRERRRDPRLLAYFAFDTPGAWNRVLRNSQVPRQPERDGAIVGAVRTAGRWDFPKSALEFKRTGSRVRISVPGEHTSLSFTCWARIDSLDRKYNALFLADNYQPGEPHWQIQEDGRLMYSMKISENGENGRKKNHIYFSPPIWDVSRSGRWMHLAAVFDAPSQTVIQYVNGEEVSRERAPGNGEVPVTRIGAGEIGNWGFPTKNDPRFAVRNLNGAIDEFAIYAAALDGAEIREMFEQGTPY